MTGLTPASHISDIHQQQLPHMKTQFIQFTATDAGPASQYDGGLISELTSLDT